MNERSNRELLTARQLAERGDTTVRTVHYYVSEGLLPPPEGTTRSAAYTTAHLARLRIIAALRAEGLSLAAIRVRIEQLGDDDVRELLRTLDRYADEIDAGEVTVLGLIEAAVVIQTAPPSSLLDAPASAPPALSAPAPLEDVPPPESARAYVERMLRRVEEPSTSYRRRESHVRPKQRPETWHHFAIDDGIEIRVREDRLRPERREIEAFIDSVHDIARRSVARRNKADQDTKGNTP
jgi:DNA-binding transcriptional MerR regulator